MKEARSAQCHIINSAKKKKRPFFRTVYFNNNVIKIQITLQILIE